MHRRTKRAERWAALAAFLGFLGICLGCMNIEICGRHQQPCRAGEQTGHAAVPAYGEIDVYYPIPYANRPNLEINDPSHQCEVLDQAPDHCRLKNGGNFARTVTWTARGITAVAPTPLPPGASVTPPTAPPGPIASPLSGQVPPAPQPVSTPSVPPPPQPFSAAPGS